MFKETILKNVKNVKEGQDNGNEILSNFSSEQQVEIEKKRKILSSLAFFIGKDYEIPVKLNKPGEGWHWNFKDNIIGVDPKDLLEKSMDYLRFVISHEGGHRRISRTDFIPQGTWSQPGFSFMMNSIEDPRDNNFVADSYHKFREQMELAYKDDLDIESKHKKKAKEKLGYTPRFMQAGFEYTKQWFRESRGEDFEISEDLSADVREAVGKTLKSARDSWLTYPSKEMADGAETENVNGKNITGEELITEYAKLSYEINLEEIWPEFKKLIEKDQEDQKMQELLNDMNQDKVNGEARESGLGQKGEKEEEAGDDNSQISEDLKNKLSEEEQKELEKAIEKALEKTKEKKVNCEAREAALGHNDGNEENNDSDKGDGKGDEKSEDGSDNNVEGKQSGTESAEDGQNGSESSAPIDIDSLSDDLKKKIKEYIDGLPEDKQKELEDKAGKAIKDLEEEMNKDLEGKLSDNPEKREDERSGEKGEEIQETEPKRGKKAREDSEELKKYRKDLEKSLQKDANIYEEKRREILPVIDSLENDLREIFVQRAARKWQSGFKSGKRIDIKRRIQEKAKGVSVMESKAWQKREMPQEKDYAISLLIDLSASMSGKKINETFKAVIVLSEVLNRLSINTEILGFNDRLYEYQEFGQDMSGDIRANMGGILKEVENFKGGRANYNDDGWAINQASTRLGKQKANEKFLLVLSDGLPEESSEHSGGEYDLEKQIDEILKNTEQKLIGLGIGKGTQHVEKFYPNSLANIEVKEMGKKLAQIIKEVIEHFDKF